MTLIEHLDNVKDKKTFLEFAKALVKDRELTVAREKEAPESHQGYGAFGWQNDTIETYLNASVDCAEANDYQDPFEPSWAAFAHFLYGGKIYE